MDCDGYQRVPRVFRPYGTKTFHELSVSKAKGGHTYCVEGDAASEMTAVDFDSVKKGLYAGMHDKCGKLPCSVDGVYFSGKNVYAVEFKTGKIGGTELTRKIYDTIHCFVEFAGKSLSWARECVYAVIVASVGAAEKELAQCKAKQNRVSGVLARAVSYQRCPQIGAGRKVLWNLDALEGPVVAGVYTLSPGEFNALAEKLEWS